MTTVSPAFCSDNDGACDGDVVGTLVGGFDGVKLGRSEGDMDGRFVGLRDGLKDGPDDTVGRGVLVVGALEIVGKDDGDTERLLEGGMVEGSAVITVGA